MSIELNSTAPDFTAESTLGPIRFHEWIGEQWVVFFTHPQDYSAVCMTELGAVARIKSELEKRNAKALGLSLNPVSDHLSWAKEFAGVQGCELNFPLIGDPERKVANLYGMIHPSADPDSTVRALFIIDPAKKVRLYFMYPRLTGRSFGEVLRVLDSLQLSSRHRLGTPANWQRGDEVIIPPSIKEEEAKKKFPGGWRTAAPYLRFVGDPGATPPTS